MKKLFILLSSIIIFCTLTVQGTSDKDYQYIPIPDNHIWSVSTQKFMTYGDTSIHNKEYLKVYCQNENIPFEFDISQASYYCALRNDTLNKRVYTVYPDLYPPMYVYDYHYYSHPLFVATDTTEFLLYDFSLNVGDTVSIYEYDGYDIFKVKMKRVEEIGLFELFEDITYSNADSLQILENGEQRKRILMRIYDPYYQEYDNGVTAWMEGIGSIHGLTRHFPDGLWIFSGGLCILLCYANEDELLLSTTWNINDNCHRFVPASINENGSNIELTIYPNPTTDFIRIINMENINLYNCWIEIFDVSGKRVLLQKYGDIIDVSALNAGYYMLKVTSSNVNINTSRFVKF